MADDRRSDPIRPDPCPVWYHGSPLRLTTLAAGSTVSPIVELARAFAHKPTTVSISIHESDEEGARRVVIEHNGAQDGFLYRVITASPSVDLEQHPGSRLALGEEMLTTRPLPLEFLEELPAAGSRVQEIVQPLP